MLLLLRAYAASGGDDLAEALGIALARALDVATNADDASDRAAWLTVLVEAAPLADDDRIGSAAGEIVDLLQATWPRDVSTGSSFIACAASVDACLRASTIGVSGAIVPAAIDELERMVGAAYRPGPGVLGGDAAAHGAAAGMLLTAFEVTGRLPYAMLAEELMQPARRVASRLFAVDCSAARVLCRLAALHDDREYRAAAVVAADADYRRDAARILRLHASHAPSAPLGDAALYGLAFGELMSLR